MTFNLLNSPWLEVRRRSGARAVVRPCDLTDRFADDPILNLDFPRPDWNAAVTEMLIGLFSVALAPTSHEDWAERFRTPPSPQALETALSPFVSNFNLDGDGPRAFQDFDPLSELEPKPVSSLLIEAPGEQTLKNNADLFVKRGLTEALCLPYAACALITLQTYAPSGGAGHRTSLRGGGPLTTLVVPARKGEKGPTLWDLIWANVPKTAPEAARPKLEKLFPWLAPTIESKGATKVVQEDNKDVLALAFFACPRRIRLEFEPEITCALSTQTGPGVAFYRTQNYGADYLFWQHPLSPYREDKKSGLLPLHPNAGQSDYGDWLAWWGFSGKPAIVVQAWEKRKDLVSDLIERRTNIWAFGYDMDNMKARAWLDAKFPWIPLAGSGDGFKGVLQQLISATDEAARATCRFAKIAIYGQQQGQDGHYMLPDTLSMDALKIVSEQVWQETTQAFEEKIFQLLAVSKDDFADTEDLRKSWRDTLRTCAMNIFAAHVDLDGLTVSNPRRLLTAFQALKFEFGTFAKSDPGSSKIIKPKVTDALELPFEIRKRTSKPSKKDAA